MPRALEVHRDSTGALPLQTIVLYTQYLQLSSASRGQPSQLVVWLATAIRLAQVFGLHLLGSNPET